MKCMDEKRNQKLSVHFPFTTRKATQREMEDLRASVCEIGERLQQTQGKLAGANAEINRLTNALKSERSAHKNTYFKLGASVEQAEYLLDQLICLRDNVSDLAAGKYEKVYQDICGTLDPEGWKLYWAAEKYTAPGAMNGLLTPLFIRTPRNMRNIAAPYMNRQSGKCWA